MHAYYFDRAVTIFGTTVEADLEQYIEDAKDSRQAKLKYKRRLSKWLSQGNEKQQGQFRDPFATM